MPRPKLEDFYNPDKFYKAKELVPIYVDMIEALDKYCDELERALDKTCKKLEEFTSQMYDEGVCFTPCIMQTKYWKKWAINEINENDWNEMIKRVEPEDEE